MDKNLKIFTVLTIVLLNALISSHAQAGFYDWLVSNEKTSTPLVLPMAADTGKTYGKIFSWDLRKPETSGFEKFMPEEPEEPKSEYEIIRESVRQVTAYNVGDVYQTDSTPCTGAYSKVNLCEEIEKGVNVCAANFVPLHTMLRIFTDEGESFECIVWDRMNSRYPNRVDIAMSYKENTEARQFGLQKLTVQVLKESVN